MFTPLTPQALEHLSGSYFLFCQLVVKKESQLQLRFPYDSQEESFEITRMDGEVFCKAKALF